MALDVATIGIALDTGDVRRGTADLNKLGEEARKAADKTLATEMAFDKLSRSMGGFNRVAGIAAGYFTITAIAGLAKEIVKVADAYTNVSSRLQVATGSYELASQAQEKLFAVSQKTRVAFTETADLFSKLTTSTQSLNISQDRLVGITATVNKAITLSGASATASQAALVQFGQGLASGTLRGEELNSILEQTPALAKALADGLGVPVGALKQLGSEGKITADKIIEAFEKVAASVDKDFAKVATTVDSAMTVLKNSLGKAVNQANETTGATNNIATAILELSAQIDDFTKSPEFSNYLGNIKTAFNGIGEAVGGATSAISSLITMAADNQGTLKFLAELAVGLRGAAAGASAGAAVGSLLPGFGTAAGAAIGAGVGYIGGVQATSSVSDAITGDGEISKREQLRKEMERLIALEEKYQGVLEKGAGGSTLFYTNGLTQVRKDLSKVTAEYGVVEGSLQDRFLKGVTLKASEAVTTKTQVAAVKALTDEQKKAIESYDKFILSVTQKLEIEKAQAAVGRELTASEKLRLELEQKLALLTGDKKKAQALIDELVAQTALNDALAESIKLRDAELKTAQASLRATTEEADKIILQAQSIGKTKEEIQLLIIEKENKRISDLEDLQIIEKLIFGETELAATYGREIDEIRRLQNARRDLGQRQTTQDAIDRQRKGYEDLYRDLSKGLTDSIFRGFEGGKKFITNFKDAIKNAFKSLIIKFAVQPVIGSVVGGIASSLGFTGIAQAAQKELGGIIGGGFGGGASGGSGGFGLPEAGGLKSIYDAFAGGLQGFSNAITQATFNVSTFAGASVETAASLANFAGPAAIFAASALAAYKINRAVSGGYEIGGLGGNIANNAGLVGGLANRAFGKKTVLGASGIQGTFTDDGFSGQTFQDVTVKRKLRSSKSYTNFGAVDSGLLDILAESVDSLATSAKAAGRVLGTDISAALDSFTLSGRFSVSTQEQLKATLDSVANAIIDQSIPALKQFQAEGENLVQTAGRLAQAVSTANQAAILLGKPADFNVNNADSAMGLSASLGGSANSLQTALSAFIPTAELARNQITLFDKTVADLGLSSKLSGDTTREQFAALLKQADLTSAAGQRELATLIELAPALDSILKFRDAEAQVISQKQLAVLQERAQLEATIFDLTATNTDKLKAQRDSLSESNLALFDNIEAINKQRDAAAAAAEQSKAISEQRAGLAEQLFELVATDAEKLLRQRNSLDESNRGLFDQIQAVTAKQAADQVRAQEAQARREEQKAKREELRDKVSQAYQAERDRVLSAAEKFRNISGTARQVGQDLFAQTFTGTAQTGTRFDQTVSRAIGGDENAAGNLGGAASSYLESLKSSAPDYLAFLRGFATVQSKLREVELSADQQTTVAEKQLTALDKQVEGILSVDAKIGTLAETIKAFLGFGEDSAANEVLTQSQAKAQSQMVNKPSPSISDSLSLILAQGIDQDNEKRKNEGRFGGYAALSAKDFKSDLLDAKRDDEGAMGSVLGAKESFERILRKIVGNLGVSADAINSDNIQGFIADTLSIEGFKNADYALSAKDIASKKQLIEKYGIKGFALGGFVSGAGTGTSDSIPAMLSNGEFVMNSSAVDRIGAPAMNMMNRGLMPGQAEMIAELRQMKAEIQSLRSENRAGQATIASHTAKTAKVLDRADNGDSLNITMVTV